MVGKEGKKSRKKIKKQQQFFADGILVENIISVYAIRRRSGERKSAVIYGTNYRPAYLWLVVNCVKSDIYQHFRHLCARECFPARNYN